MTLAETIICFVFAGILIITVLALSVDYFIMRRKERNDEKPNITADRARRNAIVSDYLSNIDKYTRTKKIFFKLLEEIEILSKRGYHKMNNIFKKPFKIEVSYLEHLLNKQGFEITFIIDFGYSEPRGDLTIYW